MNTPDVGTLYRVLDATWPAASARRAGVWTIREGQGGGQRVSSATADAPVQYNDIMQAEVAMAALGQTPLFMVRPGEEALDGMLEARGHKIKDPVALYCALVERLTQTPVPLVSAFYLQPPLAIVTDIWEAGGIGLPRRAVMDRVTGPKTAILARHSDRPAGAAFVGICDTIAMVHAIEVVPALRKQGVGANILRAAAHWAQDRGATHLALAVTRANKAANALYTSQGMTVVGDYHYRIIQGRHKRPEQQ
ncbi:MAG: GNAT family N-acetyltransferase [Rhodobacteraceae bacterium]|nr:GNAT family N-acetyltransferase [Paracoccaceae bacterium]